MRCNTKPLENGPHDDSITKNSCESQLSARCLPTALIPFTTCPFTCS